MYNSTTSVLISRFLVDLQQANQNMMHQHSQVSSISSLNCDRIIGSLGASLLALGEVSQIDDLNPTDDAVVEDNMNRVEDSHINGSTVALSSVDA